jgi:4-diphosphocytidyl-2C-methyl-D-erythritol kinase
LEVVNDLEPAAVALRPELGDVINELASHWDRPVMMSGSGSAVFGYFADLDEAEHAVSSGHGGLAMRACTPIDRGVRALER